MTGTRWRRILMALLLGPLAVMALLNTGGWRARLFAVLGAVYNAPELTPAPAGFVPRVPAGFTVSVFARGFKTPRWLAVAPNGDVFLADSHSGQIWVLHDPRRRGVAESRELFAGNLNLPFGIAFHESYVYIADTDQVMRFHYDPATSQRQGNAQHILDLPALGYNEHWTRSIAFSLDGGKMYVSVGSGTNVSIEDDRRRAAILMANADGSGARLFAAGLRNAVGIACNPESGRLWASVNERDNLGDDVPQDYFTSVQDGGFYGWPYSYTGHHVDNRVSPRPDLVARAIVPDLLLGGHVAPLQFAFYEAQQFPSAYRHGAFLAEHGSWNRRIRSGYQVVFVPFANGVPAGSPMPFLTGFAPDPAKRRVYGRPVGVAVAADGSLLVSDDAAGLIWRVAYSLMSGQ